MAESFTPGPWAAVKWPHSYGWHVIHPAGDAELGNWMMAERIRREADAALIAAAPTLYEALADLCTVYEQYPSGDHNRRLRAFEKARAALALARGEES